MSMSVVGCQTIMEIEGTEDEGDYTLRSETISKRLLALASRLQLSVVEQLQSMIE